MLVLSAKTGSSASEVYGFGNTTITNMAYPYNCSVSPYELFDAKDALLGGSLIGTASSYDNPTNSALSIWRGAKLDDASGLAVSAYGTGATTITVTSAIASCCPGQHVYNTTPSLIGVIKSISSNVITLEHPALTGGSGTISVKALRGLVPRITTGRITTDVGSAVVNGGLTKFLSQGLGTGTWDIFTTDYTFVGTVSAVASDSQLTLSGNAAVSLASAAYIAVNRLAASTQTSPVMGWLNCHFAGHQFYAKGNTVYFSDFTDPEGLDMTLDGSSFTVSPDPVRALLATTSSLVIITENEAYALEGAVGTTPDRWRPQRISDDGTICGMTGCAYTGGVIWAGKRGVWFWNDGGSPQNIVDAMDGDYRLAVSTFTATSGRAYCGIAKDHYLLFIEGIKSGVFQRVLNSVATDITRPTITVHLTTGAIGLWENVEMRGYIEPAQSANRGTCLFPITTTEAGPVHAVRIIDAEQLFIDSGQDAYLCEGAPQQGPKLFLETKKYDMGDPQRLKLFRMFLLNYFSAGGNIKIDPIPGLNTSGTTQAAQFLASTSFVDKRLKFNTRSQFVAYRLNESDVQTDPAGTVIPSVNVTVTIASPGVVTSIAHGLSNGDQVFFTTSGALPTGLAVSTYYYVVNKSTDTFQVSLTSGGAAINTSGTQSGTHSAFYAKAASITRITLGPWASGYKWKRPGRV
jgi:hypothetical protein